ncbi:NADP-dependent oxidoreductase [Cryptosporangium aurantiacum]|uniref:NADPH:quinone reductase n=1 Tax=Cryptosporangium aurantiacum TaxID=134849 RepID=A0A1M7RLT8_9ACTN|nr:NADP-dependent oxidoreductase [Cryptosporangium aurantiacum]SHN47140.1 NADPH:quinone reductase [Cryptosporangium aurantiacum]
MKALRYAEYGDPSVLTLVDVERPVPGPGQVLVETAAAAFNPVDAAIRAGYLQPMFPGAFPYVPGIELAGRVAEIGPDVVRLAPGDAVIGFLPPDVAGASAEYVVAPASALAAAPRGVPLADAAALPVGGLTAWQALFEHAKLRAGQRLLINGAGGSVGGYAIQLAARAGAHVIATASPRTADRARRYGAAEVIDHTVTPVLEAVTEPVDVVLNLVSEPGDPLLGLVASDGVYVSTITDPPTDGPVRALRMFVRPDAEQLATLGAQVDAGELEIDVAERLPLRELPSVHERAEAGTLAGKVVLIP